MPTPVATLQTANPSMGTVSRQPQTTGQPASPGSAPFTRLSRRGEIPGPTNGGQAFGQQWTPILKPVGGYLRNVLLTVQAVSNGATAAAASADAPYNTIQNLYLRDPFGQPVIQADGFSLFLINLYGGQRGMLGFGNNPAALPSFSAVSSTTGAFNFKLNVPLEMDSSSYCSLPNMNATSQPQLQINLNSSATVYSSITGSAPTVNMTANEEFWMAPVDHPEVAPPDVGSSAQWSVTRAAAGIAQNSYQRVVLPTVGTFLHTLILILRDSTNARIDSFPSTDLQFWIDGVPVLFETLQERTDKMYAQFGVTRPTGVLVYTFRDSVQDAVSTADTYDLILPTTPATSIEIGGTWGTIANAPAQLYCVTGLLFPSGGLPYTHLAQ